MFFPSFAFTSASLFLSSFGLVSVVLYVLGFGFFSLLHLHVIPSVLFYFVSLQRVFPCRLPWVHLSCEHGWNRSGTS